MALLCKKVENEFIGVQCGIMDQFAVAKGGEGQAILLNCDNLDHEYLPFNPGDLTLTVINTRKERKLAESKYNERFIECSEVLSVLRDFRDIRQLCEITPSEYEELKKHIKNPILQKRGEHVTGEQDRVQRAAVALKAKEFETFGRLMFDSHRSLKELYEVSGGELDCIVEFSKNFEGCIGARMTGAGFGGCAIALVRKDRLENYQDELTAYYSSQVGYLPEIFESRASEGVRVFK
jgi:galactokinase